VSNRGAKKLLTPKGAQYHVCRRRGFYQPRAEVGRVVRWGHRAVRPERRGGRAEARSLPPDAYLFDSTPAITAALSASVRAKTMLRSLMAWSASTMKRLAVSYCALASALSAP
jgi:hypothetical protein